MGVLTIPAAEAAPPVDALLVEPPNLKMSVEADDVWGEGLAAPPPKLKIPLVPPVPLDGAAAVLWKEGNIAVFEESKYLSHDSNNIF